MSFSKFCWYSFLIIKSNRLCKRVSLQEFSFTALQWPIDLTVLFITDEIFWRDTFSAHTKWDGPCHAKTCFRAYADSEGPDQSAHPRRLIRTFTARLWRHWVLKNITKYSEIDQTIYPRWLIVICTVCIYREDTFPHVAPQMILSPVKLFWNIIFLNYFSASTYINEKSVTECQFLQWSNREIIKFHENCFRYKTFPLTTIYFIYKILHSTVKVVPLSMPLI